MDDRAVVIDPMFSGVIEDMVSVLVDKIVVSGSIVVRKLIVE